MFRDGGSRLLVLGDGRGNEWSCVFAISIRVHDGEWLKRGGIYVGIERPGEPGGMEIQPDDPQLEAAEYLVRDWLDREFTAEELDLIRREYPAPSSKDMRLYAAGWAWRIAEMLAKILATGGDASRGEDDAADGP